MEKYLGVKNSNNPMSIVPVVTTRSMTKITFAVLMYEKDTNSPAVASVGFDYVANIKKWSMSFCIFPDKARYSPFKEDVRRYCEEVIYK